AHRVHGLEDLGLGDWLAVVIVQEGGERGRAAAEIVLLANDGPERDVLERRELHTVRHALVVERDLGGGGAGPTQGQQRAAKDRGRLAEERGHYEATLRGRSTRRDRNADGALQDVVGAGVDDKVADAGEIVERAGSEGHLTGGQIAADGVVV